MPNIPSKPSVALQEWIDEQTPLDHDNLTNGVNQNINNLKTAVDDLIDALGGEGSEPPIGSMSVTPLNNGNYLIEANVVSTLETGLYHVTAVNVSASYYLGVACVSHKVDRKARKEYFQVAVYTVQGEIFKGNKTYNMPVEYTSLGLEKETTPSFYVHIIDFLSAASVSYQAVLVNRISGSMEGMSVSKAFGEYDPTEDSYVVNLSANLFLEQGMVPCFVDVNSSECRLMYVSAYTSGYFNNVDLGAPGDSLITRDVIYPYERF